MPSFQTKSFLWLIRTLFPFNCYFKVKYAVQALQHFHLEIKWSFISCFLFLMRYNSAFILYKEKYKRQYIKKYFTFSVYKWKQCLPFALDTFRKNRGKYMCTANSEIRAISTTAKRSFRERNWTFLSSVSARILYKRKSYFWGELILF